MIAIVDYGMGNLRSVQKAFERLGHAAEICSRPEELEQAEKLVLPGVGAFRDAVAELKTRELIDPIRQQIAADRPFLGICLGLQLLFDRSFEGGEWDGLGIVSGDVVRFEEQPGLKIPHMGWNTLEAAASSHPLLHGIPDGASFYFVHSFYVAPQEDDVVIGRTEHGIRFVSMIGRGGLSATQFHPEKSQKIGLKLLENFAAL